MNVLIPRFVKAAYRKEPISSFIVILGSVDAVMGGVSGRLSLFSLGIGITLLAFIVRWWNTQAVSPVVSEETPRRYLPPSPTQPPLPHLTHRQRHH
ncbi:MAG: hypothetical protein AB4041_20665 [Microcystaceae cyanobacterium]